MTISVGKVREYFAIIPNVNYHWINLPELYIRYLRIAWLFWFIDFSFSKWRNNNEN